MSLYARPHPDEPGQLDIRDFEEPPPEGKGWRTIDPPPAVSPTQVVSGFDLDAGWIVRDKTPAELRVVASPRQIRQALNAAGLRQQIEAGVAAADQDTRDWWEFATSFESDHPSVLAMCAALGISDAQRQQVFDLAATL